MNEILTATVNAVIGLIGALVGALLTRWIERRRASDREALALWRIAFDRPAFKGPYTWQSDQAAFKRAIKATREAITTGVLSDSQGKVLGQAKAKTQLRRTKWRSVMDAVDLRLGRIDALIPRDAQSPDASVGEKIDRERDEIIQSLNEIWDEAKIPKAPIPTTVPDMDSVINL